jgi:purine-nucleoside/S-methyl-5'-thioadenosine phosphorylase / adenosine deaminase
VNGVPRHVEPVPELIALGFLAYTTTRQFGSLGMASAEPVHEVMARWKIVTAHLESAGVERLATATQIHGAHVITHAEAWRGWLRHPAADGHACAAGAATGVAVTVADCVPVFLGHPSGAMGLLHSGWRGTEARIVERGVEALAALGCEAASLVLHLGPAVCGRCYEVSPDVYRRLTGKTVDRATPVDLRSLIAEHARACGVERISVSDRCTRCDNDRFFSHRGGDQGRQISVMAAPPLQFA